MDYVLWRDLVTAYVRVRSAELGWTVEGLRPSKSSASVYIDLRQGRARAVVRLSDHRPHATQKQRASMFSVRSGATSKLRIFDAWLRARLLG